MMKVRVPEGTTLTGNADTIVRLMRDDHWTVGDQTLQHYMERVRDDAERFQKVKINTASPRTFLRSLAENGLINILEDDEK